MKAVIIDIQRNFIIVVNQKGEFIKIPNKYKDRQIGDEIDVLEIDTRIIFRKVASIAAVLIITTILAGYGMAFYRPVTYVTIDVNPSVEISLNRFDRVLDVEGLNEEGKRLVGDGRSFKALPADEAVRILLDRAREQKFLVVESVVMITISNVKDEEKLNLERKLEYTARKELEEIEGENGISINQEGKNEVELYVQHASIKLHSKAKKLGISQGKLMLYEKLKERDSKIELESVKNMRVKDILEELKFNTENKESKGKADETTKNSEKGLEEDGKLKESINNGDDKSKAVREINETKEVEKDEGKNLKQRSKVKNKKDSKINPESKQNKDGLTEKLKKSPAGSN
ncbi:MAG: hypothetical protein PWP45_530 [Tepidanaerobacteraceae bacterium]|nr:hypothetical protein [Tepidanaerobacteraceae bacterium]